ncbi:hypothetical protein MFRU_022g00590 [Monilinia fructicola]|uniref:RRM domain-containing protein n=1 Tax=Monilinia fructicola TaxID=38448 RepID=A0A5M9JE35_MONFR|nr:hypothetical protein EYC84_009765 [Monilinia fructicola]KAG4028339.1 hypothetical protein MFRU_022g00590 [Monilinia fructicola]
MATTAGSRNQANGVLSVTTSQTSGNTPKQTASKPASSKMKLIVRRLAPGLTEAEFFSVIGEDWKVGQGKVDWFQYKAGKDSKDPSKPSRPSRAYLHLTNSDHLLPFSEVVRKSSFEDAKNTYTNSCLIGPPSVEFAPYNRVPTVLRRRTDARAGTIDQDAEFMAFLEGLANPVTTKEAGAEGEDTPTGKAEKVTVTPLVQFLKDKKANKTKESAAKASKKQDTSKSKAKEASTPTDDGRKSNRDSKTDKVAATQEAVKILNREAAKKTAAASTTSSASSGPSISSEKNVPKLDTSKIPANERQAVVAAHVRMLRRDLGLNPSQAHRRIKRDTASAVKAEASEKPTTTSNNIASSPSTPTTPTGPKLATAQPSVQSGSRRSRRGNQNNNAESSANKTPATTATTPSPQVVLLKKPDTQQRPQQRPSTASSQSSSTPQVTQKVVPKVTPAASAVAPPQQASQNRGSKAQLDVPSKGARQAFIKHANPSQGVTESLLKEALEKFGKVSMVEIDKKKGFAYADFEDPEGLKKAMAANPVSVAQGTVHVMQRKGNQLPRAGPAPRAPPPPPANPASRGGRGGTLGRRGGRNGGGRGRVDTPAVDSTRNSAATAPIGPVPK